MPASKPKSSPKSTPKAAPKAAPKVGPKTKTAMQDDFLAAFEALLKHRKLKVPAAMKTAPPEAYARQRASVVEHLAKLDDASLQEQADKIAGWAKRQAERAADDWNRSPIVGELRRRKLKEPQKPK